jgi:glucose-1-phosphate thymidylyltransferase
MRIFGVIPAAGRAKRLSLPFSKELYPFLYYYKTGGETTEYRFRPVISFLIDRMVISGVQKIFVIINKDKFDVLRFLGNGNDHKVKISYLIQEEPRGMPEALGMVYDWSEKDSVFVFGMPDTIFYPEDALRLVLEEHISKNSAVTIGAFPTDKPNKYGMIEFDKDMNLTNVIDKPESSNLKFMWGIACWNHSFLHFLVNYLDTNRYKKDELLLSDVFLCAINQGLSIKVLPFTNGEYYDIGTMDDLFTTTERIKHSA